MKLYYAPGACSLAPHITLIEAGLPFSTERVDLRAEPHKTESGADYKTINAKGYVPTLELDKGDRLTEAAVVVQYIADQAPEKGLAPPCNTLDRYRLQEWLNFISSELHKGFGPFWKPDTPQQQKEATWARLSQRFDWLDPQLADKDYLMGEFSVADAYLFTILRWPDHFKLSLDRWPALQKYRQRVGERPAVRRALEDEGIG
ncbi:glutathione transferase GstA [Cupriavidus sp. WGtm5]|uniref:glutathione transferase GstA n=1 Tax=Cupriavidus TaxID=106589 RepID=UPI000E10A72D|nr:MULTISPECIES: glutathione transferase GstA [Cupriavidus]MCO4890727.1 glutathione transferase GstA [Cupriavidus sp. WGtm5]ULX50900.1 glutathione transferase GstA [Cupriavidus taiwanensis]SPA40956.1 glutathione S-transferase [Cupriavidus taiwanensis]SPA41885.1 glutathione S-transferase [Cupriavidus taiwanensis]